MGGRVSLGSPCPGGCYNKPGLVEVGGRESECGCVCVCVRSGPTIIRPGGGQLFYGPHGRCHTRTTGYRHPSLGVKVWPTNPVEQMGVQHKSSYEGDRHEYASGVCVCVFWCGYVGMSGG